MQQKLWPLTDGEYLTPGGAIVDKNGVDVGKGWVSIDPSKDLSPEGNKLAYKWIPEIGEVVLYTPLGEPADTWVEGIVEDYDPVFWGGLKVNGEWVSISQWKWKV